MPRFTKDVVTDDGRELTLERVTSSPAEITALRVSGWEEVESPDTAAKADGERPQATRPAVKPTPKPATEA